MIEYIISGYDEKVFKLLDKITNKLEDEDDKTMVNFYIEKKWENHILVIYIKSKNLTYYGGVAYCKLWIKEKTLFMEINELEVARLFPENNKITERYFNYIKNETRRVDELLYELMNEI